MLLIEVVLGNFVIICDSCKDEYYNDDVMFTVAVGVASNERSTGTHYK